MVILILIGVAVAAAARLAGTPIFVPALVNAAASVWGNGVLANFRQDPQAAPNGAAFVSVVTTVAALGFLGLSFLL